MKNIFLTIILSIISNFFLVNTAHAELVCSDKSYSLAELNTIEKVEGFTELKVDETLKTAWHTPITQTKNITIVVHGLNYRSDHMNEIVNELTSSGSKVLNVSLPGTREARMKHSGKFDFQIAYSKINKYNPFSGTYFYDKLREHPERNPTLKIIHNHLMKVYCLASMEADRIGVDLNIVAYSMGATLFLSLMNNPALAAHLVVSKMVLFAPAMLNTSRSSITKATSYLLGNRSFEDQDFEYSFDNKIPARLFTPLTEADDMIDQEGLKNSNIPTLVIIHQDDELISQSKIKAKINDEKLTLWSMTQITTPIKGMGTPHTIVKEQFLGAKQWQGLMLQMKSFLNK